MEHTTDVTAQTIYSEKEDFPGAHISHVLTDDYLEIHAERDLVMRVYFIDDHILRFRYAIEGYFEEDFSYAIDPAYKAKGASVQVEASDISIIIKTQAVICEIATANLRVTMRDIKGQILLEDEKGFHWEPNQEFGGYIVKNTKKNKTKEAFYGLGDKPTDLNIAGKRFQNWGTDEYGYHVNTDPLYKSIPIYYGLHDGRAYGIFLDNTYRSYFDFGKERKETTSFWSQGGEMNYYFIAGPELMDVCRRYTMMTGTPEMPPMWALGFQQCKWSYYPESNVKEIAGKMRELEIPCDAIYLDIDYMDGFRCFTWNLDYFPDPKRMVDELAADGFKTMVIIDPGIKKDKTYKVFQEGMEKGYFCKRVDGPYVEGKVWPGMCYFPDFTRPEVRDWWAGLYKELIEDIGIAGVWNDMNEPALFEVPSKTFPYDVIHDYDGHPTSHRKAHNIYGMQMARATAEGVKKFRNGKRTLIITRSGYSGLQRYSSVWTGDNIATWDHLWLADIQAQRLAVSGISFAGSDIGGFIGQPTAELMIRWIQLGIFHPFCRVHSSGDHGDQEPWAFGDECTAMYKKFIEIRYQLLPYMYTTFYQYHTEGTPMLRPIVFYDQATVETVDRDYEFLCGDHLLICPVMKEGATTCKAYFPKGNWYDYWTGNRLEGSREHLLQAPLDIVPIYIKEGAVIPNYPIQQYVGEKTIDQVALTIYYKEGEEWSYYYEDGGDGYEYENGNYRLAKFYVSGNQGKLTIKQMIEGTYSGSLKTYKITIVGLSAAPTQIHVDGQTILSDSEAKFVINAGFGEIVVG